MSRGEGCGGHGRDAAGVWVRDDACDLCQRHDWVIFEAAAQTALEQILHAELCGGHPTAQEDGWYDHQKRDWRTTGSILEAWLGLGWTPERAPVACATCSRPPLDPIHVNCLQYDAQSGRSVPCLEDQHPFASAPTDPEVAVAVLGRRMAAGLEELAVTVRGSGSAESYALGWNAALDEILALLRQAGISGSGPGFSSSD